MLIAVVVIGCRGAGSAGSTSSPSPTPSVPLVATTEPAVASTVDPGALPSPSASVVPVLTPSAAGTPTPTASPAPTAAWTCAAPITVDKLAIASTGPLDALIGCFGHRSIDVTGYLAPPWGIGGLANGVTPAWLGEWAGLDDVLWLKPHPAMGCVADDDCVWLFIHAPDATALPLAPDRWVTLTGHFDDPASLTCRATGAGPDAVTSDAQAIATCRGHFVVTGIRTVKPPA